MMDISSHIDLLPYFLRPIINNNNLFSWFTVADKEGNVSQIGRVFEADVKERIKHSPEDFRNFVSLDLLPDEKKNLTTRKNRRSMAGESEKKLSPKLSFKSFFATKVVEFRSVEDFAAKLNDAIMLMNVCKPNASEHTFGPN
jgi:hypothetical protein